MEDIINNRTTYFKGNSIIKKYNIKKDNFAKTILNKNNKLFQKNINESEYSTKMYSTKNSNTIEFPTIQYFQHTPCNYNKNKLFNLKKFRTNSNDNYFKQFIYNPINFDDYKKGVIESQHNAKGLPLLHSEEINKNKNTNETILNDLIIPEAIKEKKKSRININNKKYSFCLKTLCKIKNIKKLNYSTLEEGMNNKYNRKIYNISKTHILSEIILNEYSDKDFNHEQQKLLRDHKYYNKWLKKKLLELKKEIPSEESIHRTFKKVYKNSKYNEPTLYFTSLSISFNCKGKSHLFHIPFEYLPLFYYKNMSNLKLILISIFKFENNFEDIIIDFNEIIYILSCCKQFEIKPDEILDKKDQKDKKDKKDKNMFINIRKNQRNYTISTTQKKFIRKIHRQKSNNNLNVNNFLGSFNSFKKNNLLDSSTKNITKKEKEEKTDKQIEESSLYKCIYNKFLFKWNTPKYNYDITVKTPEAVFQVGNTILKAYIDIGLIFNLIENNFKNWDYYISQYIFSYKECLRNMNELTSVKSMINIFPNEFNSFSLNKNNEKMKDMYIKKDNINNLNKEKIQQISDKSKIYEFLYTDEKNNNYLKIFHSFFIASKCRAFIKSQFYFDFNFFYMKILNKILRIQGLNYFLKKLIYIDKDTLSLKFKYDELSSLGDEQYKILEKIGPNVNGAQACIRMKEKNKDIINFTLTFPVLETIKYNNKNYDNCFESDYDDVIFDGIPLDTLNELCRKNYDEWPDILLK